MEYTHTYTHINKTKQFKNNKYNRLTWQAKETKTDINQLKIELTKGQTGKQNQSSCQLGNKAMKTKTNQLLVKRKKRKKRKTRKAKLNRGR